MPEPRQKTGAKGLFEGERLADITVHREGRCLRMLGAGGPEREKRLLPAPGVFPGNGPVQTFLPVLIGSGTGAALDEALARLTRAYGPDARLAVVDKERDILAVNGFEDRFAGYPGLIVISENDSARAIRELTRWQTAQGGLPLLPLLNPFYLRLDRAYYDAVTKACEASGRAGFWERARYAKFKEALPRILLLTSKYFLIGEISSACDRLGLPYRLLQMPEGGIGRGEFIESLLTAVVEFRPDFVFTINHLGIDREGVLTDLMEKLCLPVASWFVDNPHLILNFYTRLVSPWTTIFTWDADNLPSLRAMGFTHVRYLPLGTDATRFRPGAAGLSVLHEAPKAWDRRVSFVGNSMVDKVDKTLERYQLPPELTQNFKEVAAGFADDDERSVRDYLQANYPENLRLFDALPSAEERLGYTTLLTWEATLQYRLSCIQGVMPYAPLITGDKGWHGLLGSSGNWHYHSELNYYTDLPGFYPLADINFNCTSKQMKGAVNQRVFDVPATESFLLTDYREQVERLFDPGREIICYHSPEEAKALAREYLDRPRDRRAVALAARKRILAEHTYERRVLELAATMKEIYA